MRILTESLHAPTVAIHLGPLPIVHVRLPIMSPKTTIPDGVGQAKSYTVNRERFPSRTKHPLHSIHCLAQFLRKLLLREVAPVAVGLPHVLLDDVFERK